MDYFPFLKFDYPKILSTKTMRGCPMFKSAESLQLGEKELKPLGKVIKINQMNQIQSSLYITALY